MVLHVRLSLRKQIFSSIAEKRFAASTCKLLNIVSATICQTLADKESGLLLPRCSDEAARSASR